jgi:hypothetical protein
MAKRTSLAVGLLAVLALVFGAACNDDGGDSEEASAVEAAVEAAFAAWAAGDAEAFLGSFTDNALDVMFGSTREELAADYEAEGMGDPALTVGEFGNTEVDGESATTETDFFYASMGSPTEFALVREGDAWLIDNRTPVTGDAGDATVVDLATTEYAFNFEQEEITSGDIAFNITNPGAEEHEVFISQVPPDFDLEAALMSEEEPEGVVDIGAVVGLTPGTEATGIFQEPLAPGNYVMLCFVPSADGTPHAFQGMTAEFTVE